MLSLALEKATLTDLNVLLMENITDVKINSMYSMGNNNCNLEIKSEEAKKDVTLSNYDLFCI